MRSSGRRGPARGGRGSANGWASPDCSASPPVGHWWCATNGNGAPSPPIRCAGACTNGPREWIVRIEGGIGSRENRLESISILIHTCCVPWGIRLWEDVESWILGLDDETYNLVAASIARLESLGPALGRPTADRIKGSRHHNMKELRPGSAGRSEIRILLRSIRSAGPSCSSPGIRPADGSNGTNGTFRLPMTGSTSG